MHEKEVWKGFFFLFVGQFACGENLLRPYIENQTINQMRYNLYWISIFEHAVQFIPFHCRHSDLHSIDCMECDKFEFTISFMKWSMPEECNEQQVTLALDSGSNLYNHVIFDHIWRVFDIMNSVHGNNSVVSTNFIELRLRISNMSLRSEYA